MTDADPSKVTWAQVRRAIEPLAPPALAESWDPVGLHVGGDDWPVSRALLCIDLTDAVVDEAVAQDCGLVVAYHPPIFKGLPRLTEHDWAQRRVLRAARAGVAVYAPHTALDAVRGGVCDWLCAACGLGDAVPITPRGARRDAYKVIVFVPEDDETAIREAMTEAGAGGVGRYRGCSFAAEGVGGFEPMEGARPAIGRVGQRASVREVRLEMLVPGAALAAVLAAARAAHRYEEPAIDVLRLEPEPVVPTEAHGAGRVLTLDEAVPTQTLASRLAAVLGVSARVTARDAPIRTVAVCPGAGGSLFEGVEADAYVTGEMRHHDVLDAAQRGKAVLLFGHTHTERPYLPAYRDRLAAACPAVTWAVSAADRCPWR